MPRRRLYTIGYGSVSPQRLLEIAERLDAIVWDCRFRPTSSKPGFRAEALQNLLGFRYAEHGHHLGGFGHTTPDGIEAIRKAIKTATVILMCGEAAPGDCHRHATICAPHFPNALHIFGEELIRAGELQAAITAGRDYEYDEVKF
jgi:uncharacterized protein (DUF488 family)